MKYEIIKKDSKIRIEMEFYLRSRSKSKIIFQKKMIRKMIGKHYFNLRTKKTKKKTRMRDDVPLGKGLKIK